MLRTSLTVFLFVLLIAPAIAGQHSDHFLAEVFAINSFKINSPLNDIRRNKQVAENLAFYSRMDNWAIFDLLGQPINLPGLKPLDRLRFDTIELKFENNKLHDVDLYIPASFKDLVLAKSLTQFNAEYGQAAVVEVKNNKKFAWNLGANELALMPFPNGLLIHYGSKLLTKRSGWIYSERKGKGNGTIQPNLPGFEKLLKQNLTVTAFEKLLPQWETTGTLNHIEYLPGSFDKPGFMITYSLANYDVAIRTGDTTSKVVSEITLDRIKDSDTFSQWEKDLENLSYIKGPKLKYITSISYSNHKFLVVLDKERSKITVLNIFKTMLP